MGEAAEASSGGGARGMRREFLVLALLAALAAGAVWLAAGGLAALAVRAITPEREAEWLAALTEKLPEWQPRDPVLKARAAMIESLLARLAAHPEAPKISFRLLLLDEPEPNAFAFPGGAIGITRGLLEALGEEEGAYAFVLGHELGHFKNRDHLARLVRGLGSGFAMAVLFGWQGGLDLAGSAQKFLELGYSRRQEMAADEFGLRIARETLGSAAGSGRLFEKLLEKEQLPAWAYMFHTHPDTARRLKRLRDLAR